MGPPLEPSDPPDEQVRELLLSTFPYAKNCEVKVLSLAWQVDEEFDLVWHDGTKHYEPVFDDIPGVGKVRLCSRMPWFSSTNPSFLSVLAV